VGWLVGAWKLFTRSPVKATVGITHLIVVCLTYKAGNIQSNRVGFSNNCGFTPFAELANTECN
jgi:hypothetical protein